MRALLALGLLLPSFALGDVVTRYPSTATDASLGGTATSLSNAFAQDGAEASFTARTDPEIGISEYAAAFYDNFGFDGAIPAGSTVNSVTLECVWRQSTTATSATFTAEGRVGGVGKGTLTHNPRSLTLVTQSTALAITSRADLLNGTLRVFVAMNVTTVTYRTGYLDALRVIVDFTPPGGGARPHVGMW